MSDARRDQIEAAQAEVCEAQADQLEHDWKILQTDRALHQALLDAAPELGDTPEQREAWKVTGDDTLKWALRKIAAAQREIDRITFDVDSEIERLLAYKVQALTEPQHTKAFFEGRCIDYHRRTRAADDTLPKTRKTSAGSVAVRVGSKSTKVTDEDAFLAWARDEWPAAVKHSPLVSNLPDYTTDPDGRLLIPNTGTIDPETGETVGQQTIPGVAVVTGDPAYTVKPTVETEPF